MTTGIETLRPIVGLRPPRRRVARAVARELRETAEPLILSIKNPEDIKKAVAIAAQAEPIAFTGGMIYGIGGSPEAFEKVARIKGRNFYKDPPVALPSWERMKEVMDWKRLAAKVAEQEKLQERIQRLYSDRGLPIHLVLPIKPEAKKSLPYALKVTLNGKTVWTQAMMCSGRLPEMQFLIEEFERQTGGKIFHTSSANRPGEKSYVTAKQVAENLQEIPVILADPDSDQLALARAAEGNYNSSYTMIDLARYPDIIEVTRLGSYWSPDLFSCLTVDGNTPEIIFPENIYNSKNKPVVLTSKPNYDRLKAPVTSIR